MVKVVKEVKHSYLIYFNPCESGRACKNMNDFILGELTMFIQFVLYSIMIKEGYIVILYMPLNYAILSINR